MKRVFLLVLFALFSTPLLCQKPEEVLATATGLTFGTASLSENVRKSYLGREAALAAERSRLLSEFVIETLIDIEAKATGKTTNSVVAEELSKIPAPRETEIKSVFDANRTAFGDRTLEQLRPQIVGFLRNGAEQNALADLTTRLKQKLKFVAGKDINSATLKPADIIFSVGSKTSSAQEFEDRFRAHIYDLAAAIYTQTRYDLEDSIFSALIEREARARSVDPGDLIAAEVTNKLKEFTDEERFAAETAFRKKLFEQYAVRITLREPTPVAHAVSADDDPVWGQQNAPVTIIMFSDFQCSACRAAHPLLKRVVTAHGGKVRLVIRDFPLESVHENAFAAALAANAARQQGRFFEYIELLYSNQDALDPASLKRYASQLGLNAKQFELDFTSEKTAVEVRKDIADGDRFGIRSTPTIFVNGVKLQALSEAGLRSIVDRSLSQKP